MTTIIARRRLLAAQPGIAVVTLEVHLPEYNSGDDTWSCLVGCRGDETVLQRDFPRTVVGQDSMQALQVALLAIGAALDRSGIDWTALCSETAEYAEPVSPSDDGFPRPELDVSFAGSTFRAHVQRLIVRERLATGTPPAS